MRAISGGSVSRTKRRDEQARWVALRQPPDADRAAQGRRTAREAAASVRFRRRAANDAMGTTAGGFTCSSRGAHVNEARVSYATQPAWRGGGIRIAPGHLVL